MSNGKFSQPRPYRDEEREIEQAFRQMTGQAPPPEPDPIPADLGPLPENPENFPELDLELNEIPEELGGKYLEEEAPPEPDFIDQLQSCFQEAKTYFGKNPRMIMVGLCAVALVMIIGFMAAFFFSTSDPYDGKILDNVYIADVHVGGMTKNQATSAVKQATGQTYSRQDMVIDLAGTPLHLKPSDTKVSLDIKAAVNAAYNYGRTGSKEEREQIHLSSKTESHFIGLLPYLNLDQNYIRQVLTGYAKDTGSTLTQTNYGLEGRMPELNVEKFDENAPGQTLVINIGTPGVGFDPEAVFRQVLDAYSLHQFRVEVKDIESETEPDPIDLEAVYEEFYIAPVNAAIDMQTFETIPGSYGYGFDLEEAQKMVDRAGYGETVRIPMEYIEPEILGEDVFFRDELASYETRHSSNRDRTSNLELACKALDGLVLNPGEKFSFNDALGKRTESRGYKSAPSYAGLEPEEIVGGGVSQVASTLYYCTLLADLSVTDRTNHPLLPSCMDYGMDAVVSWGGPDFKFINSTNYPIQLEAGVSDGYVKIRILGTDEKDYYVQMDYKITDTYEPKTEYRDYLYDNREGYEDGDVIKEGTTGYYVKTYKLKYDKETGELLSRDFETNSRYATVDEVVARVEPEETEPPTTEETVPPTTEETEPPTTAPTVPSESTDGNEPEGGNGGGEEAASGNPDQDEPGDGSGIEGGSIVDLPEENGPAENMAA